MHVLERPKTDEPWRAELCAQLASALNADYQVAFVILDSSDYKADARLLPEFKDTAFCWTPDRPTEGAPAYLVSLMHEAGAQCLVWVSSRALQLDGTLFSWIVLHEFRHAWQHRNGGNFPVSRQHIQNLRRRPEFLQLPPRLFQPAEIDAELFALDALATRLHGGDANALMSSVTLPRYPFRSYNAFLLAAREQWISYHRVG